MRCFGWVSDAVNVAAIMLLYKQDGIGSCSVALHSASYALQGNQPIQGELNGVSQG